MMAGGSAKPAYAEHDPAAGELLVGNGLVDARWRIDEAGRVRATRLAHLPTDTEWVCTVGPFCPGRQDTPCPLYAMEYTVAGAARTALGSGRIRRSRSRRSTTPMARLVRC